VIFFLVIFWVSNQFLDWTSILKITSQLKQKINIIILIIFFSFFLRLILDLISSVLSADQNFEFVSFINLIINLFQLAGILILTYLVKTNKFMIMTIYYSITPLIILLFFNVSLFKSKYKNIRPHIELFDKGEIKQLFNLGSKFFLIQIAVIIVFATDNIIILRIFSAADVTIYNVCYKYFNVLTFGWNIIMAPYWVAFNDAYVKRDFIWISTTIHNLQKMLIGLLILIVLFLIFASYVFKIWVNIKVPLILTIYMGLFVFISSYTNIYVYLLNGLGKVNIQLYVCIFASIVNIPLCLLFTKYCHWGVEGIIFSSVLTIFPSLILGIIQYRKIINNLKFDTYLSSVWNK